jgi:hypothetical protein
MPIVDRDPYSEYLDPDPGGTGTGSKIQEKIYFQVFFSI